MNKLFILILLFCSTLNVSSATIQFFGNPNAGYGGYPQGSYTNVTEYDSSGNATGFIKTDGYGNVRKYGTDGKLQTVYQTSPYNFNNNNYATTSNNVGSNIVSNLKNNLYNNLMGRNVNYNPYGYNSYNNGFNNNLNYNGFNNRYNNYGNYNNNNGLRFGF